MCDPGIDRVLYAAALLMLALLLTAAYLVLKLWKSR